MRKIRRGKDIKIEWDILTNGEIVSLSGRDLRLVVNSPIGEKTEMSFIVSGNTVSSTFTSKDDTRLGAYSLTLWENYGKKGQTAVDACCAFTLVPTTCAEGGQDEGLDTETIELSGNIELFTQGESGSVGIPDAPFDGNTYGRNNGAWVIVEGSGDFVTDEELTNTLQGYAKKTDIPDVSGLLNKTEAAETYQPKGNYLTEIPKEYVTDNDLETKLNDYALKENIPDVSNLATKDELKNKQDTLVSGENIATINGQSLLNGGNIVIEGGSGGTTDYNALSNKPQIGGVELSGNKSLADLGIQPQGDYATTEQLASKADATAIPTKVSQLTNDSGYITNIPDEYVTDTELDGKGYATQTQLNQAVSDKLTKTQADGYYQPTGDYALKSEIPDTSQLATKEELSMKLDTETYNTDKSTFATKEEIGDIEKILDNIIGG